MKIEIVEIEGRSAVRMTLRLPEASVNEVILHNFRYEDKLDAEDFVCNLRKARAIQDEDAARVVEQCLENRQYWSFINSSNPVNLGTDGDVINVAPLGSLQAA